MSRFFNSSYEHNCILQKRVFCVSASLALPHYEDYRRLVFVVRYSLVREESTARYRTGETALERGEASAKHGHRKVEREGERAASDCELIQFVDERVVVMSRAALFFCLLVIVVSVVSAGFSSVESPAAAASGPLLEDSAVFAPGPLPPLPMNSMDDAIIVRPVFDVVRLSWTMEKE